MECKRVKRMGRLANRPYVCGDCVETVSFYLFEVLQKSVQPVFICVGTPRVTGDALGPMVGSLVHAANPSIPLYGTMDSPIHALNLVQELRRIRLSHPGSTLIAVDSSLSSVDRVGYVCLDTGKLKPGRATKRGLPSFGSYTLYGNIADAEKRSSSLCLERIATASPKFIESMAKVMSTIILESWNRAFGLELRTS